MILEFIFKEQLKGFLLDNIRIQEHVSTQKASLEEYKGLLKDHEGKVKTLREKIRQILELYHEGKIDKEAFPNYHTPVYDELKQRENSIIETQAMIDMLSINTLSRDQVLEDARDLQERWDTFSAEEKRREQL